MKGRFILLGLVISVSLFCGCATPPKTSDYSRTVPPLQEGQGRIWFYALRRGAIEFDPAVRVNYAVVGSVQKRKCFYVDLPPGNYLIECTTEWRGTCHIDLHAGQTRYVRFIAHTGIFEPHIQPTEMPEANAIAELSQCDAADLTTRSTLSEQEISREHELIQNLTSPNESKVLESMVELEKKFPADTNAWIAMEPFVRDARPNVRRKAARVLGIVHADINQDGVNDICAMLNASEPGEQVDALKSLRGLNASSAVPRILPLLKSSNPGVVRDACRTLAVLGNNSAISSIEPLLQHPDKAVQADAKDAIFQLERKPPDTREVKKTI